MYISLHTCYRVLIFCCYCSVYCLYFTLATTITTTTISLAAIAIMLLLQKEQKSLTKSNTIAGNFTT